MVHSGASIHAQVSRLSSSVRRGTLRAGNETGLPSGWSNVDFTIVSVPTVPYTIFRPFGEYMYADFVTSGMQSANR
jgi:hypothetical protein